MKTQKETRDKIYVVDTNIILNSLENLTLISDDGKNTIVIPETVLIELEDKKKDMGELGYQARSFIRMMDEGIEEGTVTRNVGLENEYSVVKFKTKTNVKIHVISKNHYQCEKYLHNIKEINDKKIIEVAEISKEYYVGKKVVFLSIDLYARIFGKLKKVATESLRIKETQKKEFSLIKKIEVYPSTIETLDGKDIIEIDPEYKIENFSYHFINIENTSIVKYAIIVNGKIKVVNDEVDFKGLNVKPKNIQQKFLTKAILTPEIDTIVVDARAGSGKTLLALSAAMKLVGGNSIYNKIIYVRNSIESLEKGAEVGFLSGNDEKFRIYNMALYDNLDFIATKLLDKKNDKDAPPISKEVLDAKVVELKSKFNIQTLWPGEARGRTLDNAIVIMDEWQNSSPNTTQLILSRFNEACKVILIGSNKQIDNMYLNKYNNGLTNMLNFACNESIKDRHTLTFFATTMETSVRGKFAHFADEFFGDKK